MRTGNFLIIIGAGLVVLGVLVRFVPGLFAWFGHLPGDVLIEGENSKVFIPFTSMVVVSIAFSVVASLVGWFFRSR
jgi:hypothetical protein